MGLLLSCGSLKRTPRHRPRAQARSSPKPGEARARAQRARLYLPSTGVDSKIPSERSPQIAFGQGARRLSTTRPPCREHATATPKARRKQARTKCPPRAQTAAPKKIQPTSLHAEV